GGAIGRDRRCPPGAVRLRAGPVRRPPPPVLPLPAGEPGRRRDPRGARRDPSPVGVPAPARGLGGRRAVGRGRAAARARGQL
ncbi:MAG: hypothetical protein AVDCRST_MAG59-975, partial [uncultured Thermomicrobiales bacterium]